MSSKLKVNNIIPSTGTQIGISTTGGGINLLTGTVVTGIITASGFDGPITQSGDFTIDDYIVHAGDTNTKFGFSAADTFSVETAGDERLRIKSDGVVNIGDRVDNSWIDSTLKVRKDQNAVTKVAVRNENQGSSASSAIAVNAYGNSWMFDCGSAAKNSNALTIRVDATAGGNQGTEKLRITTAGNVGINSTIPRSKLHAANGSSNYNPGNPTGLGAGAVACLESSGDVALQFLSSTTTDNFIYFGDTSSATTGSIQYDHNVNALLFNVNGGTQRLRIDNTGKVGINRTTTLVGLLDVKGVNDDSIKFSASSYGGGHLRITGEDRTPSGTAGPYGHTIRIKTKTQNNNAGNGAERDALILYHEGWSGLHTASFPKGNVEINDGDLVVANGHGIDFSATPNPTNGASTSELLDYYEEGTFTPSINGMGSIGYSVQAGKYTKIGNTVFFQIRFNLSSRTAGSHAHITNMPFTASTATIQYAQCTVYAIQGLNCSANHHPIGQFQSSEIYLYEVGYQSSSNYGNMDENHISGTAQFGVYGFYYTAT